MKDDAMEVVKKCRDCQFFQKQMTKHANPLWPIDIFWPFAVRGIDIVGILPRAPGGIRYLFIGVDTFTKWMKSHASSKYNLGGSGQVPTKHYI
jgi:hypothetical protein